MSIFFHDMQSSRQNGREDDWAVAAALSEHLLEKEGKERKEGVI